MGAFGSYPKAVTDVAAGRARSRKPGTAAVFLQDPGISSTTVTLTASGLAFFSAMRGLFTTQIILGLWTLTRQTQRLGCHRR